MSVGRLRKPGPTNDEVAHTVISGNTFERTLDAATCMAAAAMTYEPRQCPHVKQWPTSVSSGVYLTRTGAAKSNPQSVNCVTSIYLGRLQPHELPAHGTVEHTWMGEYPIPVCFISLIAGNTLSLNCAAGAKSGFLCSSHF